MGGVIRGIIEPKSYMNGSVLDKLALNHRLAESQDG